MDPELASYYAKTEKELAQFRREVEQDLKEWRHEIAGAIRDIATETRERFQRADGEREVIKDFNKTEFGKITDKLDKLTSLAESTNGKVQKHEKDIYGDENSKGLKSDTGSLKDSRTYITVLIGFICTMAVVWWTVWGSEAMAKGIVNKTESQEIELINKQIWKHNHPSPKPDEP